MEDLADYYADDSLSAAFHDLLAQLEPGCANDAAFYLSLLAVNAPANILELGCGAGPIGLALSRIGHNVEGIDIAESMLRIARLHRSRLDVEWANRLKFTNGDMTTFSLPRNFDLVIAPYFALNHLSNREAVFATFKRTAEHLAPTGCFALHLADINRLARPLEQEAVTQATVGYDKTGNKLQLDLLERHLEPLTGSVTMIIRYSMIDPNGDLGRVSAERT
jgi:2-polyprenyl-3-methyl-5-hydroxy-6-metoxy-1,4-benzoquinol methylase